MTGPKKNREPIVVLPSRFRLPQRKAGNDEDLSDDHDGSDASR
jgi:hypothetical protein